ncbi:MAG: sigma-70 family RNA polymerase sigma factor [Gaiellales bacterium]
MSICIEPRLRDPSASVLRIDPISSSWLERLGSSGRVRDDAIDELRTLLVRATRFELARRRSQSTLRDNDLADLAEQSADDALVAILAKLPGFRGESRFTTWAYKFALYEAAAAIRRRAWQRREIPLEAEAWLAFADHAADPHASAESHALFGALGEAITNDLTPHQREVLLALALNDVPIDVLAERLATTRGALYKALHDARQKLRAGLAARGMALPGDRFEEAT